MKTRDLNRIAKQYPSLAFLVANEEVADLLVRATRPKRWWSRKRPLTPQEFKDGLVASDWWKSASQRDRV